MEQPLFIYDLDRENHNNMGSTVDHDFIFQDIETQIHLFIHSSIYSTNISWAHAVIYQDLTGSVEVT